AGASARRSTRDDGRGMEPPGRRMRGRSPEEPGKRAELCGRSSRSRNERDAEEARRRTGRRRLHRSRARAGSAARAPRAIPAPNHLLELAEERIRAGLARAEQPIVRILIVHALDDSVEVEPGIEALADAEHAVEQAGTPAPPGKDVYDDREDRQVEHEQILQPIQRELELEDREVAERDRTGCNGHRSMAFCRGSCSCRATSPRHPHDDPTGTMAAWVRGSEATRLPEPPPSPSAQRGRISGCRPRYRRLRPGTFARGGRRMNSPRVYSQTRGLAL